MTGGGGSCHDFETRREAERMERGETKQIRRGRGQARHVVQVCSMCRCRPILHARPKKCVHDRQHRVVGDACVSPFRRSAAASCATQAPPPRSNVIDSLDRLLPSFHLSIIHQLSSPRPISTPLSTPCSAGLPRSWMKMSPRFRRAQDPHVSWF